MKVFVIEKNAQSMFSAIFKSFYDKIIPDEVVEKNCNNLLLGDEIYTILNNKNISDRVENALIKYGGYELLNDVKLCLCSSDNKALTVIFNFLYYVFYSKKDLSTLVSSPYVCEFNYLLSKVKNEINRTYTSLKFNKNQDGVIYATFSPKNDIIDVVAPFFVKKLSGLPFIIYDKKRNKTLSSNGKIIIN